MVGKLIEQSESFPGFAGDDLQELAAEWSAAEETKRWAEEQIRALMPEGSTLQIGPYLIRRNQDSLQILQGA